MNYRELVLDFLHAFYVIGYLKYIKRNYVKKCGKNILTHEIENKEAMARKHYSGRIIESFSIHIICLN